MDLAGEGIKVASTLFRQAAWIFEQLLTMSTQLPPDAHSCDFNKETLMMNSNLCLAQAQYLFFKKASDAGMAPAVLSKVAAQVAIYFEKAFEQNQVSPVLRSFDNRRFSNVLGYHARYFSATAYWQLGSTQFREAGTQGKGMNKAVALLTLCVEKYTDAKPYAEACGGAYLSNFNTKFQEAQTMLAKAIDDNKKIYYEKSIPTSELPKLDPQNFVNLLAMSDEVNQRPEIDEKLRHIVPPAVRAMQDELKQMLQAIIQGEFSKVAEKEEQMTAFLKQFGLPQVLHSFTASNDVPDAVWSKIEEFQKKGAAQNFSQAIAGAESLKQVNTDVINQCKQTIENEEAEDTQLRTQHGAKFNRPPSASVNQAYKQSLFDYQ